MLISGFCLFSLVLVFFVVVFFFSVFRRGFIIFWGWECEFRYFLRPLILISDQFTIKHSWLDDHCERGDLSLCCSLFLLHREKAVSLLQETSQILSNLGWSRPEPAYWQRFEIFLVNLVRLRRWAQSCYFSTLPLSGRKWWCTAIYTKPTAMRIHDKDYHRDAWPGEAWKRDLLKARTNMQGRKDRVFLCLSHSPPNFWRLFSW